jgi:hypothetical protein
LSSKLGRAFSRLPREKSEKSRWRATAVTVVVVAGGLGGTAAIVSQAMAATTPTGTLSLGPKAVTAGDKADTFVFTYASPSQKAPGTITIDIPAGFTVPQDTNAFAPGYVRAAGLCSRFQVTGIAPGPAGSSAVTIAENCLPRLGGLITYSRVSVPSTAGSYPFAASLIPSGSSASTSIGAQSVTVRPAPLAHLTLAPATATITPGGKQAYTVTGTDTYGNAIGTITNARFTIEPDGTCTGATCTATALGTHTVTATSGRISGTATLTVASVQSTPTVTQTATGGTLTSPPVTPTVTETATGLPTGSDSSSDPGSGGSSGSDNGSDPGSGGSPSSPPSPTQTATGTPSLPVIQPIEPNPQPSDTGNPTPTPSGSGTGTAPPVAAVA